MHALEMALFNELKSFSLFKKTRDKHWGIERIVRRFQDNTEDGKCHNCDQHPTAKDQPFF